jgi:exopolyphosphatase/guanosine-5'-triphosphate,3'-diphosphate pyrophosphatase
MIFSAIDIGSNAGRLLVATVYEKEGKPVSDKITLVRVPLRLGFDVFDNGFIAPEREELLIRTFDAYNQLKNVYSPIDCFAVASEAFREASNGADVAKRIEQSSGIKIHVISERLEAEIIGSAGNANLNKPHEYSLYIDLGGGSIELGWFKNDLLIANKSFPIGTIRLLLDKVPNSEWEKLKIWIQELNINDQPFNCICSGGNINKLTKLFGNLDKNTLTYSQLVEGHEILEGYSLEDRIKIMGLRADRADVIVEAAIIFKKLMKLGKINELQAPKIGLADGLVVELYKKHMGWANLIDQC